MYMSICKFYVSANTYFSTSFFLPLVVLVPVDSSYTLIFISLHILIALLLHSARFSFQHAPQGIFGDFYKNVN